MRFRVIFVLCCGLIYNLSAMAQLKVIGNNGDSLSATPYYRALQTNDEAQTPSAMLIPSSTGPAFDKPLGDIRFPVQSSLTPGDVSTQKIAVPGLSQPLFVIGDDKRSIAWVQQHQSQLQRLHALGIVTNIEDASAFAKLQQQVGLPLVPASLDDLTRLLPVQHYPFLIAEGMLLQ